MGGGGGSVVHIFIVLAVFLIIFHSSLQLLFKDQECRKVYVRNIRTHQFFTGIDWTELEAGETPSPLISGLVSI